MSVEFTPKGDYFQEKEVSLRKQHEVAYMAWEEATRALQAGLKQINERSMFRIDRICHLETNNPYDFFGSLEDGLISLAVSVEEPIRIAILKEITKDPSYQAFMEARRAFEASVREFGKFLEAQDKIKEAEEGRNG